MGQGDDSRLNDLLDAWEDGRDAGYSPAPEELCRDCPDLLGPLRVRVAALERMAWVGSNSLVPAAGAEALPGYRLVRPVGRGGFGEVWAAAGPGGFPVALKFVPDTGQRGAAERKALEAVRGIRHPHLLAVFGVWSVDGWLVVGTELADRTLADVFRADRAEGLPGVPGPELVRYIRDAAEGIDYLNSGAALGDDPAGAGVQHRDIKPSNLLLVGGRVKVGDYGLAKPVGVVSTAHTGALTPLYAAPEFFAGRTSPHSDQYSLAATYCHLRSGRPPFDGTAVEVLRGHVDGVPDLSALPDAERNAVARSLNKDPARRWPSCLAFVEAITAAGSLAELPQTGTGPALASGQRLRDTMSRRTVVLGSLAVCVPAVGFTAALHRGRRGEDGVDRANNPSPGDTGGPVRVLGGHRGVVSAVAFSPDGRSALSAGFDGTVRFWDLASGREQFRLDGHREAVRCVAFTPDGERAVSAGGMNGRDFVLRVWDLRTGDLHRELPGHRHHVHGLVVLPDGHRVVSASLDGTVRRWNLDNGREALRYQHLATEDLTPAGWPNQVWQAVLGKDGKTLACGLRDGTVRLLDAESGREVGRLSAHRNVVSAMTVLPDGRLVTADSEVFNTGVPSDNLIRVWELGGKTETFNVPRPFRIRSLIGTRDGSRLLVAGHDPDVQIASLTGAGEEARLRGHGESVWCVAVSPDGTTALTGDAAGTLRLWAIRT